ncbi:MAG: ATP-binding protein [Rhodothermales bacterium]
MNCLTHRFSDPDTLIDRAHSVFSSLEEDDDLPGWLNEKTMHRLKLAVHEWLANLVQHANFGDRRPDVSVTVRPGRDGVECVIEDNSEGFDLNGHLDTKTDVLDAYPERGMGLLMIKACTEGLSYTDLGDQRHRLTFVVSSEQDPWLNIPF